MAFTPGTNEKRRTEGSPRRTSLHRRTEGHGVYFCRVAAVVAGQKACGFHPEPRVSRRLSLLPFSPTALPRIFPLRSTAFVRPGLTVFFSSLSPRRSLSLFFSLPATPLFMPPHSPGSSLSRARFPLYPTRAISPSLSPFLHRSSSASPAPELNHLRRFFADIPHLPFS